MATQTPGTKLTIISGSFRGRKCIHVADVFDKPVDAPVRDHGFKVQLVSDDGQEQQSIIVGCHQVKVGW